MELLLTRTERTPDGTFGELQVLAGGLLALKTCEDDWKDNERSESCIPAGRYVLQRTIYRKHGYETFEVTGVPNRSRILIHAGNTEEDTMGCILVGLRLGPVRELRDEDTGEENVVKRGALESKKAFALFMDAMSGIDEARLEVVWAEGLP